MPLLRDEVLRFIRKHGLLFPGERVAVACSGGADSVALFRLLLELRDPLGLVLSAAHFNHRLRGAESDADEQFVKRLAGQHTVEFHAGGCDVAARARARQESLETAARNARYGYFDSLMESGAIDKVALAHTMNDQAETVLMRLLRGAGGLGMAGMAPWRDWPASITEPGNFKIGDGDAERAVPGRQSAVGGQQSALEPGAGGRMVAALNLNLRKITPTSQQQAWGPRRKKGYVRPLLAATRKDIEAYLGALNQPWREDPSNQATAHTRNRIRHELLPALQRDYNPQLIESLSHTAELARAEEEYWSAEMKRILPALLLPGSPTRGGGRRAASFTKTASGKHAPQSLQALDKTTGQNFQAKEPSVAVNVDSLHKLPLALQRRVIRAMAESLGETIDFQHTAAVLDLLQGTAGSELPIGEGLTARRTFREIVFFLENRVVENRVVERPAAEPVCDYGYDLAVPGEVFVPELKTGFTAKLVPVGPHSTGYNRPNSRSFSLPGSVRVRNWRPGDKARLAHSKRAKKVKEILQEMHLSGTARRLWPVIEFANEIVWIRNCKLEPLTNGLQEIQFEEAEDAKDAP